MPKKEVRRSISLRGDTYDKLGLYADANQLSKTGIVEELVAAFFEKREPQLNKPTKTEIKPTRESAPRPKDLIEKKPEKKATRSLQQGEECIFYDRRPQGFLPNAHRTTNPRCT